MKNIFVIAFLVFGFAEAVLPKWCLRLLNDPRVSTSSRPSNACRQVIGLFESAHNSATELHTAARRLFRNDVASKYDAWDLFDKICLWSWEVRTFDMNDVIHLESTIGKLNAHAAYLQGDLDYWIHLVKRNPNLRKDEIVGPFKYDYEKYCFEQPNKYLVQRIIDNFANLSWQYNDEVATAYKNELSDCLEQFEKKPPTEETIEKTAAAEKEVDVDEEQEQPQEGAEVELPDTSSMRDM